MNEPKRRDILVTATKVFGAVCVVGAVWPVIKSFGPTADDVPRYVTYALDKLAPGEQVTLTVEKQPYFLRHLTPDELSEARNVPISDLRDPDARNSNIPNVVEDPRFLAERASERKRATVENRLIDPSQPYILLLAQCPRLGCVPVSHEGEYGGWFCPCAGSHFDTLGRIRKGPAPANIQVPIARIEGGLLILPHPVA